MTQREIDIILKQIEALRHENAASFRDIRADIASRDRRITRLEVWQGKTVGIVVGVSATVSAVIYVATAAFGR